LNPHLEAYETSKVAVPSLRNRFGETSGNRTRIVGLSARDPQRLNDGHEMVDSEGIEPSSPGCKPGILPLNDEPILAGRTGFEPVGLFADNEAATLAASRPLRMVPAVGFEPTCAPVLGRLRSAGFEPAA
jgi:hypothetical protein